VVAPPASRVRGPSALTARGGGPAHDRARCGRAQELDSVAAMGAGTGEMLGERSVGVGSRGCDQVLQWARAVGGERVWALEDCRHVSGSLERLLIAGGGRVVRVPTRLMANSRRSRRERGTCDRIDALAGARAALAEGIQTLPTAELGGTAARHSVVGRPPRAARARALRLDHPAAVAPFTSSGRARAARRLAVVRQVEHWRGPSRRCASASLATSCGGDASSPRRSTRWRPRSPSWSASSRRSFSASLGSGR
jgi:hypothetical protein